MKNTLPVVKKLSNKKFEIVDIDVADVVYSSIESGVITYVTKNSEKYSQIITVEEQERYLERFDFMKVERGYIVNTANVKEFDGERNVLHFSDDRKGPVAPVSKPYVPLLKQKGIITSSTMKLGGLSIPT